jgi:hypothetical protein
VKIKASFCFRFSSFGIMLNTPFGTMLNTSF